MPTATAEAAGPADGAAAAAPKPGRVRDPYFDNAKFLLLALVVTGHIWASSGMSWDSRTVRSVYAVVYLFHMPAFIALSGYFSRSFTGRADQMARLVSGVLVPYLVFAGIYGGFRLWVLDQHNPDINVLKPWYASWFLVALFLWRLSSPLWRAVRWPVAVAALVSVLGGTVDATGLLDFGRVLQFLPFFVLGLYLRPEHFDRLRTRRARLVAVPVLLAIAAGSYAAMPYIRTLDWLNYQVGYEQLHTPLSHYLVVHTALLGGGVVAGAAVLTLVPTRRTWFTAMGGRTMYAYLLHPMVLKVAQYRHWYDSLHNPQGELLITAAALLLATVLMTAPVQYLLRWLVEPRLRWLLRA